MKKKAWIWTIAGLLILAGIIWAAYAVWFAPARILVVNALPAREADLRTNNTGTHVELTFKSPEDIESFDGYDAIILYGRALSLDSMQMKSLSGRIEKGVKVYTFALRNFSFDIKANLSPHQIETLDTYARNANAANCRNMLIYLRALATPRRLPHIKAELPMAMPDNLYYTLEPGHYFRDPDSLTTYLRHNGIYHPGGKKIAFISGTTFPVEGGRPYIDTLISRLTQAGHNVYPLSASGRSRAKMLRNLKPDAVVYLPMGRIGNDSLVGWLNDNNIPLFTPFPLTASREEWLDIDKPIAGGTLSARILIPEIDGGIYPICIATQQETDEGMLLLIPEPERIDYFTGLVSRHLALRDKPNKEKRIAIGFFRNPGNDALLASNMEVIPSLYRTLCELKKAGYDLGNLPSTEQQFALELAQHCTVLGDYAPAAQKSAIESGKLTMVGNDEYVKWAAKNLLPDKFKEVTDRYGQAPGSQMVSSDSIALNLLRYGNIVLFPQPRPALGDDDFRMRHGAEVAPPHNYIATYLWLRESFGMDALLHFGTHGNLEFTPGKNVGLSQADWADVLVGPVPHFYLYVTSNVGEAIIAKRRSHAVMITHLTAPFVRSNMRSRYSRLIDAVHSAISAYGKPNFRQLSLEAKRQTIAAGLHRTLRLDSIPTEPWSVDDLAKVDMLAEEIADEKITGANYVLGSPYATAELNSTVEAICSDRIAYLRARKDRDAHRITTGQLQDRNFVGHKYLPAVKADIARTLAAGKASSAEMGQVIACRDLLLKSSHDELASIMRAFDGGSIAPAPGGDPIASQEVLPTGRNMYSVNPETAPTSLSWQKGVELARATIDRYRAEHNNEYPQKINYTFWAGEFISSEGATLAQALYMLGVEPLRDDQNRIIDLRLIPSAELGRPRIDVVVQVSGQLRDIAASRLKLITDAVKLAAEADDGDTPNYVAEGSRQQGKELIDKGTAPARARELSHMRVFGPVNSGYGTGMLPYTENSGSWDDEQQLVDGYINNMSAMYGNEENWGKVEANLLPAALKRTKLIVQPRQSNTWGPLSLDHVYEYTGSVSLAVRNLTGEEPDAMMADYRNADLPRMQDTRQAVAVEARASLLNPDFIRERMKGGATTAAMFGEMMRNVFGWSATRPSALDEKIHDEIYDMYIADRENLGIREYFERVNPAAYQEISGTLLECARKGYWKASPRQLSELSDIMADMAQKYGAPCTEFVCANGKLQEFVARNLSADRSAQFKADMNRALGSPGGKEVVLRDANPQSRHALLADNGILILISVITLAFIVALIMLLSRSKKHRA